MHEFDERDGEVAVLLVEAALGTDYNPHVGEGAGLRVRARGIAGKFWLVRRTLRRGGGGWVLSPQCARRQQNHSEDGTQCGSFLLSFHAKGFSREMRLW